MINYLNNSYTRAIPSGIAISTMASYSKGSVPLSLSIPISAIIDRTLSLASESLQTHRETLDRHIASLTVPLSCTALGAYHYINRKTSNILDVAAAITLLAALNTKLIQPSIRFIAPTQLVFSAASIIQQIPLIRDFPTLQKFSITYLASLTATQLLKNSPLLADTESHFLPTCQKFALTTLLGFVAMDCLSLFTSKNNTQASPPFSIDITPKEEHPLKQIKDLERGNTE